MCNLIRLAGGVSLLCIGSMLSQAGLVQGPSDSKPRGADCLFVTLCYFGQSPESYASLLKTLGEPNIRGYSLLELRDAARGFGLHAESVELEASDLEHLPQSVQAVLLLHDPDHYVLFDTVKVAGGQTQFELQDPRSGYKLVDLKALNERWSGPCAFN